jgi:hypothetical protein
MYDIEFSSDIYCNLTKIDFDNLINIINDIRYSLQNNFTKNLNQNNIGNNINNNNFLRLFKMKIQKIEINFIIASIFRLKNDSEVNIILFFIEFGLSWKGTNQYMCELRWLLGAMEKPYYAIYVFFAKL